MVLRQDASTGRMVETSASAAAPAANGHSGDVVELKVYAPFEVYFEGEAASVTAANETGPFDILPGHHDFLCMLTPCDLVVRPPHDEPPRTIRISRALLYVKADKVTVFVDV